MRLAVALLLLTQPFAVQAADVPSFSRDIVPNLTRRCAVCHMTGTEPGKLSLVPKNAYRNLVNVASPEAGLPRVDPGRPERSYLLLKLDGTHLAHGGRGARMPLGGPALPEQERELIRQWIKGGAPEN